MKTLDELKENWANANKAAAAPQVFSQRQLEKMFRQRIGKHTRASMQYFWASFTLQIIVYALFTHVLVKYWSDPYARWLSTAGILLYAPFTFVLFRKFKRIAAASLNACADREASMQQFVFFQYNQLKRFYCFKKWYEYVLIPIVAAIGVLLCFRLYVPGGAAAHPSGVAITFGITIVSCALAIRSENKKSFELPLSQLRNIVDEFRQNS